MPPMKFFYKSLYSLYRDGYRHSRKSRTKESPLQKDIQTELLSDRSRILYSSAFRRLQQKAQVFSMETNSNVRSRLTHSLEVADLGRRLADRITMEMKDRVKHGKKIPGFRTEEFSFVASIVENACLMHDIGNPPFGHFGESAIQDWALHDVRDALPSNVVYDKYLEGLMADFREFDGNPQGFRMVTRLLGDNGLCLTCSTLLCALKYARPTGTPEGKGILKKAGWFQTEQNLVKRLADQVGRSTDVRYPLTYIMEAADDISYCMSDIADGIEKRILTEEKFILTFCDHWEAYNRKMEAEKAEAIRKGTPDADELTGAMKLPREITRYYNGTAWRNRKLRDFNMDFAIPWATRATEEAAENYRVHHAEVYQGISKPLMSYDGEMARVLKVIGNVCCDLLYPSIQAESIELTGYAVISGIIKEYTRLLRMPHEDFRKVTEGDRKHFPVETRQFNRFDEGCVKSYLRAVAALEQGEHFLQEEWWLRVHLLVDHISSMTDAFALETYQMLKGIALMRT